MRHSLLAAVALATLVACAGNKTDAPVQDAGDAANEAPSTEEAAAVETAAEVQAPITFGETFLDAKSTPIAMVLNDPSAYADKVVIVEGEIRQVCQKMGCWFELSAGPDVTQAIRVTSPAHDILIPTDSSGKTALAKGTLIVREVTEEEAEHYRSEGAQAEAGMELTLKMTGVTLK